MRCTPVKPKSHGDLVLMAENQTPCDALICEHLVAESNHQLEHNNRFRCNGNNHFYLETKSTQQILDGRH
jgi:hypothetical protein